MTIAKKIFCRDIYATIALDFCKFFTATYLDARLFPKTIIYMTCVNDIP